DVLEIIFGLAVYHRLPLDAVDGLRHIPGDELIAEIGADQNRPPAEAYPARLGRLACARLKQVHRASSGYCDSSLTQGRTCTSEMSLHFAKGMPWEFLSGWL